MPALVDPARLARAKRVLFVTHLAIGDFTYMQTYFAALRQQYPHLEIDLWIDEVRRTWRWWKWAGLKRYSLYDWVKAAGYFNHVYTQTYSPAALKASLAQAQQKNYDIVFSVVIVRNHKYARLARSIAPNGYVVGITKKTKALQWRRRAAFSSLNGALDTSVIPMPAGYHVTDLYAAWFEQLCNLDVPAERRAPVVHVPREWQSYAKLTFLKWGIKTDRPKSQRVVFINLFAKGDKRSWTPEHAFELIELMQRRSDCQDAYFILNALPDVYASLSKRLLKRNLSNTVLFSAREHFFQLPAILAECDLVISVETAVMHLAAALKVPVISLMRRKNPEWAPWGSPESHIVTTATRDGVIASIPAAQVAGVLDQVLVGAGVE